MSEPNRAFSRRAFVTVTGTAAALVAAQVRASSPATPAAAVPLPDSPAGMQLAWVLDHVRPGATMPTEPEIAEHFAPAFLAQVPTAQLIGVLQEIAGAYGPLVVTGFASEPTPDQIVANVTTRTGESWVLFIAVETLGEHRIVGLHLVPADANATPVALAGFDDLIERWGAFAEHSGLLISEIVNGSLHQLAALNEREQRAIGSAFKLYVLGAVASAAGAGKLAWTDNVTIQDRLKSLPSGELQNDPNGTKLPIRSVAEKMISISDNTAADHLLDLVGREAVEAMMPAMGNSDPSRTLPFLSTAEMFKLKLVASEEQRANYIAADVATRRTLLADVIDPLSFANADLTGWNGPRAIDTLEWFASPTDAANAMLFFHQSATKVGFEPVADILAINPGIQFDTTKWPYVGYKGGSEPGVLCLVWLLRRADDHWFIATGVLNDTNQAIDENGAILTFAGFPALLEAIR